MCYHYWPSLNLFPLPIIAHKLKADGTVKYIYVYIYIYIYIFFFFFLNFRLGGLTPKHLDAVAFITFELFGINNYKLSKHVSMLIWLSAQQKSPPLGYPRQTGVLIHLPIPPQSADSGGW